MGKQIKKSRLLASLRVDGPADDDDDDTAGMGLVKCNDEAVGGAGECNCIGEPDSP